MYKRQIHTRYNKFGMDFYLVDTAGMRKKGKTMEDLEFYSVMRSVRAIENADVCLLVIDATQGFEAQDMNIFHLADSNRKGIVILVNKWDLVDKSHNTARDFEKAIREMLLQLDPHSTYLTAEEMKGVKEVFDGSFSGIGIEFNVLSDTVIVVNVIAGGPSEKVGLLPNDRIVKADGKNICLLYTSPSPRDA